MNSFFFMLSRPQAQIIDVKCEKFANKSAILIHKKLFMLSRPQVNVHADTDADAGDAKLQLQ